MVLRYDEENYFLSINASSDQGGIQEKKRFPVLTNDAATIDLSVIIPSYNEQLRLPPMLDETLAYLIERRKRNPRFRFEVIIVDDGSTDRTSAIGLEYTKKYSDDLVRVLTLKHNRGKGGAVCLGMHSARGKHLLFADADGATKFEDIEKLEAALKTVSTEPRAIAVGSRAHLEKESVAKRSFFRTILMIGFHFLVWLLCVRTIHDTQCGFKLFTRDAARLLFSILHVERWAFDVELLSLAERLKIPIIEVPVRWQEMEGSKLVPVFSWLQMGKDVTLIWLWYFLGIWKAEDPQTEKNQ